MQHIKAIWPTVKDIAEDLGVPYTTAHSWMARGNIPARYDLSLIKAAKRRGKSLTLGELASARRTTAENGGRVHSTPPVNPEAAVQPRPAEKRRSVA